MNRQAKEETSKDIQVVRPARALSPFEEMDRMIEDIFPRDWARGWLRPYRMQWPSLGEAAAPLAARVPSVDVINRDDEIVVRAEIPGIEKDDLDVSLTDDSVTIRGESKRESKEEKGAYYRCEISHGAFARTIALPDYVNTEAARAKFKDGVLELTLPKLEKSKRRSVKID